MRYPGSDDDGDDNAMRSDAMRMMIGYDALGAMLRSPHDNDDDDDVGDDDDADASSSSSSSSSS